MLFAHRRARTEKLPCGYSFMPSIQKDFSIPLDDTNACIVAACVLEEAADGPDTALSDDRRFVPSNVQDDVGIRSLDRNDRDWSAWRAFIAVIACSRRLQPYIILLDSTASPKKFLAHEPVTSTHTYRQ
jgi:hypothetical protein